MWRVVAALAALLATTAAADARMHAPYRGHRILPGNAAPLDNFTSPSAAYSFRKLKSTYAGPAVRLRRASDNAELDIAFLGCTAFTGCPWDEAAASAHCAATSCFVKTIYDQSGNANALNTNTGANQPLLVFNCKGSLPCLQTTSASLTLAGLNSITPATGNVSLSVVAKRTEAAGACTLLRESGTGSNRIVTGAGAGNWQLTGTTSITAPATDNVWHAAQGVIGTSDRLVVDGVAASGTLTGLTTVGAPALVGQTSTTCSQAELIVWDNYELTPAEDAALTASQRGFWGTP